MITINDGEEFIGKCSYTEGKVKLRQKVCFTRKAEHLWLDYQYNKTLTEDFKKHFSGMKWHGYDKVNPIKKWSILYDDHNRFQIAHYVGENPYATYDNVISAIEDGSYKAQLPTINRPTKEHQNEMIYHWVKTRFGIWAAEMGLGKSLSAIQALDIICPHGDIFWVSINSALHSVKMETKKWSCKYDPKFFTYDKLKKHLSEISNYWIPPQVVIFDESHKLKNITTQRSQAALYLVNRVREFWKDNCYILMMTGTPAPKSPIDWYSQCEIACPGFIREGNIHVFKDRLAITEQKQSASGGVYPQLLAWRDSTEKCDVCGKTKDDYNHSETNLYNHPFIPCKNEVEYLYKRMRGLVLVKTKKQCLDLPDKVYDTISCKTSRAMDQAMKSILRRSESTIRALTLCRELSDGFQYTEIEKGWQTCQVCAGTKEYRQHVYIGPEKTNDFIISLGLVNELAIAAGQAEDVIIDPVVFPQLFELKSDVCPCCNGRGETKTYERSVKEVETPKDKVITDLLDEYDEVGRVVIYAGFTASIDKLVALCGKHEWQVIKVDGKGWSNSMGLSGVEQSLTTFQELQMIYPKIAFVGHPASASMGITLTASPVEIFYSNDFNGEYRIQAEDRIHRIGMDVNRGARIIDILNLPTDKYVLDNLKLKKDLQAMSLGQLQRGVEQIRMDGDYE